MQTVIPKLRDEDNVVSQEKLTTALIFFKIAVPQSLTSILEDLLIKSKICVDRMLEDRTLSSSKHYKEIPCVLSKALVKKYQRNKKLKSVKSLVLPVCGDKGKQVKIVEGGVRVPAFFKKTIIPIVFPKPIIGFIRQVEFFKRGKIWFMSYCYNTLVEDEYTPKSFLGVDRNSVGNVATIADVKTGEVLKLGPCAASITKNFRNRRSNLQRKGAKNALTKLRRNQLNRTKDINHKVSRAVVDYAKEHRSAIALEDLGKISKKGKAKKYVQKSQWSFFQLETFIKYKAALLGVPVVYINPAFTSQVCSRCGSINRPNGKHYKCSECGHFDHRDANAAFNISAKACLLYEQAEGNQKPIARPIGGTLNQRTKKVVQLKSLGGAR